MSWLIYLHTWKFDRPRCVCNFCTFCLGFPPKRVLMVSSTANRTDLMLCLKKGQSLGTSVVRETLLPSAVPCWATEGQDRIPASSNMMLFVDAVRSSSSTKVSHKVTSTSCTCEDQVKLHIFTFITVGIGRLGLGLGLQLFMQVVLC